MYNHVHTYNPTIRFSACLFPQYDLPELLGLQSLSCEELYASECNEAWVCCGHEFTEFPPVSLTSDLYHPSSQPDFWADFQVVVVRGHVCMAKLHCTSNSERRHRKGTLCWRGLRSRIFNSCFGVHFIDFTCQDSARSPWQKMHQKLTKLGPLGRLADSQGSMSYDSKASSPSSQASNQMSEKYEFSSRMGRLGTKTVASRSWPDFMVRVIRFGAASGCGPSQKSS